MEQAMLPISIQDKRFVFIVAIGIERENRRYPDSSFLKSRGILGLSKS
jgi:hypothetical protein